MAIVKSASEPISVKSAINPNTGFVTVNVFNGARQLMAPNTQVLFTVRDGAQNVLFRDYVSSPSINFELPYHNNFADNYAIIAFVDGYEQAGFQPVVIGPHAPAQVDLMLIAKDGTFKFARAQWSDVQVQKPLLAKIFAASGTGSPGDVYSDFIEDHPDRLACLLNITTAMQQICLLQGSPLDYFKTFDLPALAPDRIFGYAD